MLALFLYFISKEDLVTFQIPDEYSLAICILASSRGFPLSRVALALAILLATSLFMGMGDAKLLAALSLMFGIKIFNIIVISFCTSAIYCFIKLLKKELLLSDAIAFAPFISIGALYVIILS